MFALHIHGVCDLLVIDAAITTLVLLLLLRGSGTKCIELCWLLMEGYSACILRMLLVDVTIFSIVRCLPKLGIIITMLMLVNMGLALGPFGCDTMDGTYFIVSAREAGNTTFRKMVCVGTCVVLGVRIRLGSCLELRLVLLLLRLTVRLLVYR